MMDSAQAAAEVARTWPAVASQALELIKYLVPAALTLFIKSPGPWLMRKVRRQ
jgi:hypothetical protein